MINSVLSLGGFSLSAGAVGCFRRCFHSTLVGLRKLDALYLYWNRGRFQCLSIAPAKGSGNPPNGSVQLEGNGKLGEHTCNKLQGRA